MALPQHIQILKQQYLKVKCQEQAIQKSQFSKFPKIAAQLLYPFLSCDWKELKHASKIRWKPLLNFCVIQTVVYQYWMSEIAKRFLLMNGQQTPLIPLFIYLQRQWLHSVAMHWYITQLSRSTIAVILFTSKQLFCKQKNLIRPSFI